MAKQGPKEKIKAVVRPAKEGQIYLEILPPTCKAPSLWSSFIIIIIIIISVIVIYVRSFCPLASLALVAFGTISLSGSNVTGIFCLE